eukprot:13435005-Heterocapsa_arctica.AAC.1
MHHCSSERRQPSQAKRRRRRSSDRRVGLYLDAQWSARGHVGHNPRWRPAAQRLRFCLCQLCQRRWRQASTSRSRQVAAGGWPYGYA